MKKLILVVFALAVFLMTGSTSALEVDLIADGGDTAFDAGDVEVTSDGTDLTITITVDQSVDPWELVESHVHVAATAGEVPQKNGNPQPGKFDYSDLDPEATSVSATEHVYTIPLADVVISAGDEFVVAVHAAIEWTDDNGTPDYYDDDTLYEETGWAEGEEFSGKNWAMYIDIPAETWVGSEWDVTGDWILSFDVSPLGPPYFLHDMTVDDHDVFGTWSFTGSGGWPAGGGSYTNEWDLANAATSGSDVAFQMVYTAWLAPILDGYVVNASGTIDPDGTMSGTWFSTDSVSPYLIHGGTWETTSGKAEAVAWILP